MLITAWHNVTPYIASNYNTTISIVWLVTKRQSDLVRRKLDQSITFSFLLLLLLYKKGGTRGTTLLEKWFHQHTFDRAAVRHNNKTPSFYRELYWPAKSKALKYFMDTMYLTRLLCTALTTKPNVLCSLYLESHQDVPPLEKLIQGIAVTALLMKGWLKNFVLLSCSGAPVSFER